MHSRRKPQDFFTKPSSPAALYIFQREHFFSEEHTFFIDFVTYISLSGVLLYNGRNENEKV